jgi:hypothetical protein
MKILVEGQIYPINVLKEVFNDNSFFIQKGYYGKIDSVGYYYNAQKNQVVYLIPKVFMDRDFIDSSSEGDDNLCSWEIRKTIFRDEVNNQPITVKELFDLKKLDGSLKHDKRNEWIRHITICFYKSLIEYRSRKIQSSILTKEAVNEIKTNIGDDEYTYLDLFLSFLNFYKKNKSVIYYRHIEYKSRQVKKPRWSRTIQKRSPLIDCDKRPIYLEINNRKKIVNYEEELLVYFLSILNHFKESEGVNISIDQSYKLIKGHSFECLLRSGAGLSRLRRIKHKYFSDTMTRMFRLCEIYFTANDTGRVSGRNQEYLMVKKYNLVFEDMIDKLITNDTEINRYDSRLGASDLSINALKHNDDGKIIDHLFTHKSVIDRGNIFYIGDSKYYKPGNIADKLSIYKQYTYAKNIIQYNINMLNNNHQVYESNKLRYRDELTEGYNITPNFLIYGLIENHTEFDKIKLNPVKDDFIKCSYQWKYRLFDRDTLFICQYTINYLFVLATYTQPNNNKLSSIKAGIKNTFRKYLIDYLMDRSTSNFIIYKYKSDQIDEFVAENFKILNGKCFRWGNDSILIALHKDDIGDGSLKEFLQNTTNIDLALGSSDEFKLNHESLVEDN